ncbi:hypothetical protein TWF696_006531 [Orbilia brochopaga]|uniref:Uncharacterized protein n=1 Tax=Orbilia brochopaga TaxID=3140254 RepID=A0AAV9UWL6_9PEZI
MDGLTLTKNFHSITFEGKNHILSKPGQEVLLRLRAKDKVELMFPSPSTAKMVQFMTRPQSLTVYYLESGDAIVLLIDDKNGTFGYPRFFSCNKNGPRRWESIKNDFAITKVANTLLGTKVFGKNHVIALKGDDEDSEPGIKTLRKYLGHSKWQNVGYSLLEKKCRDLMLASGMDFDHFFPKLKGARGQHLLSSPPQAPTEPARKVVYERLKIENLVKRRGHRGPAAGPGALADLPAGEHQLAPQASDADDGGEERGDLANNSQSQVAQPDHSDPKAEEDCEPERGPGCEHEGEGLHEATAEPAVGTTDAGKAADAVGIQPTDARGHEDDNLNTKATRLAPAPKALRTMLASGGRSSDPLERAAAGQGNLINPGGSVPSEGTTINEDLGALPNAGPAAGSTSQESRKQPVVWGDFESWQPKSK